MKTGIDCYMSRGTADAIKAEGHRLNAIRSNEQFQIGPWTVLPFDTVHDAAEPLGFLVANGTDKLLFATDTAYIRYRFQGLTHIAVECNYQMKILRRNVENGSLPPIVKRRTIRNHMSLETTVDMLRANDLGGVREIHLLHLSDGNSNEAEMKRAVQRATGKPVTVCEA